MGFMAFIIITVAFENTATEIVNVSSSTQDITQ